QLLDLATSIAPCTLIYALSLHDALPISGHLGWSYLHRGDPERIDGNENKDLTVGCWAWQVRRTGEGTDTPSPGSDSDEHGAWNIDRKSTRLNSSHVKISYAVFCLKKKKK